MERGEIRTFEQLQTKSKEELLQIPFLGRTNLLIELLKVIEEIKISGENNVSEETSDGLEVVEAPRATTSKPLPFDGNVIAFLGNRLSALPEREQIIVMERHKEPAASLNDLARRFGVSRRRILQLQRRAQNRLRRCMRHPVVEAAQEQLAAFADGYIPNSGGYASLDGDPEKIRQFGGILRWIASRRAMRSLVFDEERNCWGLTQAAPINPSKLKKDPDFRSTKREWNIYIVRCSDNTLYTGISRNVEERRPAAYFQGRGAVYTQTRYPLPAGLS